MSDNRFAGKAHATGWVYFELVGLNERSSENLLFYSGLTLNQYGVASPCRTICTVCGFVALS
ncbi:MULTISPECIES: hypothetical protein [Neisseria]|uniref:hypothetical protein n=1 Tax=Neisseria TaxID=482 RepID=UPI0003134CC4